MNADEISSAIKNLAGKDRQGLFDWLRLTYPKSFPRSDRDRGGQAEAYICGLVGGTQMHPQSPHDIKFSKLSGGKCKYKTARNWTWSNVLGNRQGKAYERLILVAEPNPTCGTSYPDPAGEYVLFDIPFAELPQLIDSGHNQIILNSDRSCIWETKAKLLRLYAFLVPPHLLVARYGRPGSLS